MKWAIVITGIDGTPTVCGPIATEYRATLLANEIETEESGLVTHVVELETVSAVRAQLGL